MKATLTNTTPRYTVTVTVVRPTAGPVTAAPTSRP